MEGLILKAYVDNQRRPKTQIAKDLGMSKQNLYQLFESEKFAPETIKNIETVFKAKWSQIKASVNIDGNIPPKKKEALNGAEKALRTIEAKIDVLFDVAVELLSATSGESGTLIRKKLEKQVDELKRFSGG